MEPVSLPQLIANSWAQELIKQRSGPGGCQSTSAACLPGRGKCVHAGSREVGRGDGDRAALRGGWSLPVIPEQAREAVTGASRIASFDHGFLLALYSKASRDETE